MRLLPLLTAMRLLTLLTFVCAVGVGWSVKVARDAEKEKAGLVERIEVMESAGSERQRKIEQAEEYLGAAESDITRVRARLDALENPASDNEAGKALLMLHALQAGAEDLNKRLTRIEAMDGTGIKDMFVHRGSRREMTQDILDLFRRLDVVEDTLFRLKRQ